MFSEAIARLFPDDGYLLVTPRRDWQKHNVQKRDYWLENYSRFKLWKYSFISSNYLIRADVRCSYAGMEGIERRWLVIEGDEGTLEQQMWIHKQLAKRFGNLKCVLYSGGKSLHAWYLVANWPHEQCFDLYAEAIRLGIRDCNTWRMPQPVRLPGGLNQDTKRKQEIFLINTC